MFITDVEFQAKQNPKTQTEWAVSSLLDGRIFWAPKGICTKWEVLVGKISVKPQYYFGKKLQSLGTIYVAIV